MVKEVIRSSRFIQQAKKVNRSLLNRIKKLITKIINNPEIGKPMRFDRKRKKEVYVSPFRLSYSHDKNTDILYLLDIYHKDEQ